MFEAGKTIGGFRVVSRLGAGGMGEVWLATDQKLEREVAIKVLDFGLAKAWDTEDGDTGLSMSPTLTQHATAAGLILGTAGYMAPEQAAGTAADRRTGLKRVRHRGQLTFAERDRRRRQCICASCG